MINAPKYRAGDIVCYNKVSVFLQRPMEIYDVLTDEDADNRIGEPGGYHQYLVKGGGVCRYVQRDLILWEAQKVRIVEALETRLEELRSM